MFTTSDIYCRCDIYFVLGIYKAVAYLQLSLFIRHHRLQLILLSRINGDAPRAQIDQRWRFGSSRAGLFHTSKPLFFESIRTWSFDRYRFAEAHPIRSFFSTPEGKRYISNVNKTLCWKPRFPNH